MLKVRLSFLLIFIVVANYFGCGSGNQNKSGEVVPTKSSNKRASRNGKLENSLENYFIAYGTNTGSEGWKDRLQTFLTHVESIKDGDSRVRLENVMGRVLQDLTMRDTRRKVGASSAWTFSPLVHLFMAMCRALYYSNQTESSVSFPHKAEFIQEYEKFIFNSVSSVTTEFGGLNPGQRYTGYGDNVGLMQKLAFDGLKKANPNSDDKKTEEQALQLATDIYELDKLKTVPHTILNGVFRTEHFKILTALLLNCSHNDHLFPGLSEQIVDKCYTGLLSYKKGLEKLLNTGDFNEGSEAHVEFDAIAKINKEIRTVAEKIAIAQLELD